RARARAHLGRGAAAGAPAATRPAAAGGDRRRRPRPPLHAAARRVRRALLRRPRGAALRLAGAGGVDSLPFGSSDSSTGYTFEDFPQPPGQVLSMMSDGFVSPGYFQALGIPVIAGRAFTRQDVDPGARPVLVSRSLVERLW